MIKSSTAKRFRAVIVALVITFVANYAISFAERSGTPPPPGDGPKPRAAVLQAQIPQP